MPAKAYPYYRDSGVKWIGQVPAHWGVKRLGSLLSQRREKVSDREFKPLSVTKLGIVPQLESAAKTDDGDNRKLVIAGDFVINSRSDRKGSSGLSPFVGSVSVINIVLRIDGLYGQYVHHLLRSIAFQEEFYRHGKGIVADLWSTRYSEMSGILLPLPSLIEQQAIADFLDRETTKIDTLVAKQEQLINFLKEKRTGLISHTVSKGLNSLAPMKSSGVDWIGEIPEHWELKRLKSLLSLVNARGSASGLSVALENIQSWTGSYLPTNSEFQNSGTGFTAGDILFGKLRPNLAKVMLAPESGTSYGDIYVLRAASDGHPAYLAQYLRSEPVINTLVGMTYGAKMPRVNFSQLAEMLVPSPPLDEQQAIATFLDLETAKIDKLINRATATIAFLKERRASLITAAVTGQIDVRGAERGGFDYV